MSTTMRILLFVAAAVTAVWILHKIRKSKVKMEDSIYWLFFAGVLLIMGLFPELTYRLSTVFGVQSPANLVFLVIIFLLLEKIFTLSIIVSQLEEKVTILTAETALRSLSAEKRLNTQEQKDEKETKQKEKKPA